MKILIRLFVFSFLLFSLQGLASTACQNDLSSPLPPLDASVEKMVKHAGKFIEKHGLIPTHNELAEKLDMSRPQLSEFFGLNDTPNNIVEVVQLARDYFPHLFVKLRNKLLRKYAVYYKDNLGAPSKKDIAALLEVSVPKLELIYGDLTLALEQAMNEHSREFDVVRNKILKAYTTSAKTLGRTPNLDEVSETLGLPAKRVNSLLGEGHLFLDLDDVKKQAMLKTPSAFKYVMDTTIFNADRMEKLVTALKSRRRMIVTTAVSGAPVDRDFLAALQNYAKRNDAEIGVYPANMVTHDLDPILLETPGIHILSNTIELSPWLGLNSIKLTAKQINPLMGLERLGNRGQSQVVGSPKMHLRTIPTLGNDLHPHQLISTGSITNPNYNGQKYIQQRTDEIADEDHVMGAFILEKSHGSDTFFDAETNGFFHGRHIEFIPEKKGFLDRDQFYTDKRTAKSRPEAIALGDIHVGDTDQKVLEALLQQVLTLKPKRIILHDLFNGHSISHHDRKNLMSLAKKAERGDLDLKKELSHTIAFLSSLLSVSPDTQIEIIGSNHNDWLPRWLNSGQFMDEPENMKLGLELARLMTHGRDPLKEVLLHGLKFEDSVMIQGLEANQRRRVEFVEGGNSYKVGPRHRQVELGVHGHAGANGARGSLRSFQRGLDRAAIGHTHTYERLNGIVNQGTFTELVLSYNKDGLSNWVQALSSIGENGEIQVFQFTNGEFMSDDDDQNFRHNGFFQDEYPIVVPNNMGSSAGQVDQYN